MQHLTHGRHSKIIDGMTGQEINTESSRKTDWAFGIFWNKQKASISWIRLRLRQVLKTAQYSTMSRCSLVGTQMQAQHKIGIYLFGFFPATNAIPKNVPGERMREDGREGERESFMRPSTVLCPAGCRVVGLPGCHSQLTSVLNVVYAKME